MLSIKTAPARGEGKPFDCPRPGRKGEPSKRGAIYYGSRNQFKAGLSGGVGNRMAPAHPGRAGDHTGLLPGSGAVTVVLLFAQRAVDGMGGDYRSRLFRRRAAGGR